MQKSLTYLTLLAFSSASLLSADLPTQDTEEQRSSEEHVSIESRPLSMENKQRMFEKRSEEGSSEEEKEPGLFKKASLNRSFSGFKLAHQNNATTFLTAGYQTAVHWLAGISPQGDSVELEDGSHWKIPSQHYYSIFSWRLGDSLTITPTRSFWSNYNYYITNNATSTYVSANLYIGPVAFGPYTHWIVGMDPTNGHVFLENGSAWCISCQDAYLFNDWAINDTIILGTNDSWFTSYDTMLINVNMNHYVRAKQY